MEADLAWETNVRLATMDSDVEFGIDVRLTARSMAVAARGRNVRRPNLVPTIISEYSCWYENQELVTSAVAVTAQSAETFTRDVLLSDDRALPLVVVSEPTSEKLVSDLANALAGVAIVARYASEATWALTNSLGQEFTCFNGAVRLYWRNVSQPGTSPWSHPRWLPTHIEQLGARFVDHVQDRVLIALQRHTATRPLWEEVTNALQLARASSDNRGELRDALETITRERDRLRRERDEAEIRVLEIDEALDASESENEHLSRNWAVQSKSSDIEIQEDLSTISTVFDVVLYASKHFKGIRFLESASESAIDAQYVRPMRVLELLEHLDRVSDEKTRTGRVNFPDMLLGVSGVHYAPSETAATKAEFGDDRIFDDDGVGVEMLEHFQFGKGYDKRYVLRMHFSWDASRSQWLVGYLGFHLPNAAARR